MSQQKRSCSPSSEIKIGLNCDVFWRFTSVMIFAVIRVFIYFVLEHLPIFEIFLFFSHYKINNRSNMTIMA